jgi:hypothetical protein
MWRAWERKENCTRLWWESPKKRNHPEDQGVGRWEDAIRMDLTETGWGMWIGFDWLRIGTGGYLL